MRQKTKQFLKKWLPPEIYRITRRMSGITWSGDYNSWAEAEKVCTGYDSEIILNRVQESSLKVKKGEAVYERDSVLFDEIQYSWPLLSALLWIAVQSKGLLNVIDFGGSLGSTYFQNRKFFSAFPFSVSWNIVEQKHFVDAGRQYFEDDELKFYYDIESCRRDHSPNTIIFSGVIQYLEKPYETLERVKSMGFEFILFDRTPFTLDGKERLTTQTVPSEIYTISYPCWFFDKKRFFDFFKNEYCTIVKFESSDSANIRSIFEGCILQKR